MDNGWPSRRQIDEAWQAMHGHMATPPRGRTAWDVACALVFILGIATLLAIGVVCAGL